MNTEQAIFKFVNKTLNKKDGTAVFYYSIQRNSKLYTFTHHISFPQESIHWENIPQVLLDTVLNNLHLMLGISYWKLFCPRIIITPHIQLTKEQADFWNIIYTKGLGEFFYKNNIDYRSLVQFPYVQRKKESSVDFPITNRALLLFGGGKDSIVSGELLKKNNKQFTLFMEGTSDIQKNTATMLQIDQIVFEKALDPQIFTLNKLPGIYNGHIPISAEWAFLGLFAAILYNYKYIITSNEQSANYGNIGYLGLEINHQWSKSFEFEKLFSRYLKEFITPNITYFSLLRPLHELKIIQIFSEYPKYFSLFSSCNRNFKIRQRLHGKNWCGECSKCTFVFIILAAFLPKQTVVDIFGKNMLTDQKLFPFIKALLGKEAFKPFECVGTPEETQLALYYAYKTGEYRDSEAMQFFVKHVLPTLDMQILEKQVLSIGKDYQIPNEFRDLIQAL